MCANGDANCLLLTLSVFGVDPDLTREGGSIPVTLTFQEATGKNVMMLPLGASDDGAHSQNEKIDRYNFINGVCVMACLPVQWCVHVGVRISVSVRAQYICVSVPMCLHDCVFGLPSWVDVIKLGLEVGDRFV